MTKLFLLFAILPAISFAKISVITTTPDIKWLFDNIGGDKVKVQSLLNGTEDVHFIEAMPHFILKSARADIFCQVGMELEIGWAPKVIEKSNNPKIQKGNKGHCIASKYVQALDIPKEKIDRSMGDVHGEGNPHYFLGPESMIQSAQSITEVLVTNDPTNAQFYSDNFTKLKTEILLLKESVFKILQPIKSNKFIQYHKSFSYFFQAYGLNDLGAIEEVPGVSPSAGRLAIVAIQSKQKNINLALSSINAPDGILKKFKELSGINYLKLPTGMQKAESLNSFKKLQFFIANSIIAITKQ